MVKLPNSILAFTANSTERKDAYNSFVEYFNTVKSGKTANEAGVTATEMNEKMLGFFKDEISRMSGRKVEDYSDLAQYCNFSDVK